MKAVILGVCGALLLAGGPAAAQSLGDEVADLLGNHPRLKSAASSVTAAQEGVRGAFSDFLPSVTLTGDEGYEITDSRPRRDTPTAPLRTHVASAALTITQNLFRGFETEARHNSEKITKSIADLALDSVRQSLLFDAAAAYLDVIRRDRVRNLAAQNQQVIKQQFDFEDERVQLGTGMSVDLLFAKSRLQIASERRVAFAGAFLDSVDRYKQVFGHLPDVAGMIVPLLPEGQLPANMEEATGIAFKENPTVRDSERAVDLADEQRRVARSPYYPTVDLIGETNLEKDNDGVRGIRRDASVRVQMTWDLFTGFSTQAASAQAKHRLFARQHDRSDVRRRIEEDVRLAWDRLLTARERFQLLKNAVVIATEVHEARRELAEVGRETVINVLDAQTEVFSAQIDAVGAEFDASTAVYRLLLAVGRLNAGTFGAGG